MNRSRRLGLLPLGVSDGVAAGLLLAICLGALLAWITAQDLIVRPARLQRELVGHAIASPLQLRRYEAAGFQDPSYQWRYSVSPALFRSLEKKCRRIARAPGRCLIAEQRDGGWWQGIGLDAAGLWLIGEDS